MDRPPSTGSVVASDSWREAAPLTGMTVLDLTQQLPGPYATLILRTLGARVIKVEPNGGDAGRVIDPAMFENLNAGKESVVLDLKTAAGRANIHGLGRRCDAFIEGFRPGVAERLGCGYATLAAVNPEIVYCSLSGFGAHGPYRDIPGHDLNYLGVAGGADALWGDATEIGMPVVDLASGTMAALAMVAALLDRTRTGRGRHLDLAMLDSAVTWTHIKPLATPGASEGVGEPAYAILSAADGRRLSVAVIEDKFWAALCDVLGWDDWAGDPGLSTHALRRQRGDAIRTRLAQTIAERPREEWLQAFRAAGVPAAPVHSPSEAVEDPQVRERALFSPGDAQRAVGAVGVPLPPALRSGRLTPAPSLGADTARVLSEIGGSEPARGGEAAAREGRGR